MSVCVSICVVALCWLNLPERSAADGCVMRYISALDVAMQLHQQHKGSMGNGVQERECCPRFPLFRVLTFGCAATAEKWTAFPALFPSLE